MASLLAPSRIRSARNLRRICACVRPDNWRGSLAANVEEVHQTVDTATHFQGDCQCGNDDGDPGCKKGSPNRYPLDSSVPPDLARSEFAVSCPHLPATVSRISRVIVAPVSLVATVSDCP